MKFVVFDEHDKKEVVVRLRLRPYDDGINLEAVEEER